MGWNDLEFAVSDGYLMACSAYTAMTATPAQIPLPPGYQFVGLLQANPAHAAAHMAASTPQAQHPALSMLKESPIWGLAAYAPGTGTMILAIRGTESLWEWIADFAADPETFYYDPQAGQVHGGMQLVYEHIRTPAIQLLQSRDQPKRIKILGHSLGAAICQPLAMDAVLHGGFAVTPELCTYESPRFGTKPWCDALTKLVPDTKFDRVENDGDRVCQVPLAPLYWKAGNRCKVYGGWKWEDITYAHHLSTINIGLQAAWLAYLKTVAPIVNVP
jgi:hypothetical protein